MHHDVSKNCTSTPSGFEQKDFFLGLSPLSLEPTIHVPFPQAFAPPRLLSSIWTDWRGPFQLCFPFSRPPSCPLQVLRIRLEHQYCSWGGLHRQTKKVAKDDSLNPILESRLLVFALLSFNTAQGADKQYKLSVEGILKVQTPRNPACNYLVKRISILKIVWLDIDFYAEKKKQWSSLLSLYPAAPPPEDDSPRDQNPQRSA